MNVLGIDVGYSKTRASTGVCIAGPNAPAPWRATIHRESRVRNIPQDMKFAVVAIDGPVIPSTADKYFMRRSESIFIRKPFHNRCKPGVTHKGSGQEFRAATASIIEQFKEHAVADSALRFPRIIGQTNFVEAFPNAFLGVQLNDALYQTNPAPKRGKRFDWLYNCWLESKLNEKLQAELSWDDPSFWYQVATNKNHDERAALICALTAICVVRNKFTAIGDNISGRFFLPPLNRWATWAARAIELNNVYIVEGSK